MLTSNHCPLCGEENKCMIDKIEHNSCWCEKAGKFPNEILELVPIDSRRIRCICEKCLNEFMDEKNNYIKSLL